MDAEKLRATQAPLKQRYREEPGAAFTTLRARGRLAEHVTCRVETGNAHVLAGLHPLAGGTGEAACSAEMLLASLAGCAGVTMNAVATALRIELRDAAIEVEGDVDFRGTLGVSKEIPVGFQKIRVRFALDTDATEEQLANLVRLTERYCVVFQTLAHPPEIEIARTPASR